MNHACVFAETYPSRLGPLELQLHSSIPLCSGSTENGVFSTADCEILIKKVIPDLDWLPAGMHVEAATAWLFYIRKQRAGPAQLSFSLELRAPDAAVQCGPATGENLIAVEFEDGSRQLHIGTEDEAAMAGRAAVADDMPARFEMPLLKYELEITAITAQGLFTQIPALEVGEAFYFHYIVAENPYLPSAAYPGETDTSTWLAVEQSKKKLERSWRAQS